MKLSTYLHSVGAPLATWNVTDVLPIDLHTHRLAVVRTLRLWHEPHPVLPIPSTRPRRSTRSIAPARNVVPATATISPFAPRTAACSHKHTRRRQSSPRTVLLFSVFSALSKIGSSNQEQDAGAPDRKSHGCHGLPYSPETASLWPRT